MALTLDTPIAELFRYEIAGLSPALSRKLAASVAVFSGKNEVSDANVRDLLDYLPLRYEDRSRLLSIDRLEDGLEASVEVNVRHSAGIRVGRTRDPRKPLFLFEIVGGDRERVSKPVTVKWFISGKNAGSTVNWYAARFARGTRFVAFGKWEYDPKGHIFSLKVQKPDELEILPIADESLFPSESDDLDKETGSRSEIEQLEEDIASPVFSTVHTARRVPVYRKLGPFQTKRLREIIYDVLQKLEPGSIIERLPARLLERQELISASQAINEIHFPGNDSSIAEYEKFRSPAQRRLIFDEFFWLSFSMQLLRGERLREPKGTVIEITPSTRKRMIEFLPFTLTDAQKRVVREIFADLCSDQPMNRLIQGDVGSGKTIVAFLSAFAVMENGYQVALMAPTEILAEQHARNAKHLFAETGYRVELLVGGTKAKEKRELRTAIAEGQVDLLIGTHAMIQDGVNFSRLGLAVIDEQHRFGVLQRAQLRSAGQDPDVLVMTATPIPRSLAMTVYGDLDVSVIDELPPGRNPVKTVVLGEDKRKGVYKGIEREIGLGRQVYVVYPLIEESSKLDLKAATAMYDDLRTREFPHHNVGLLHGRLRTAEKDEIMNEFVSGKLDILVSTTVIEVGVDVPNASLMVIEHAERFGLSQLHQLRGRVGRGAEQSYCILLTDIKKTVVAKQRLGIMEKSSDGFVIAEKDLEIRGQGEILGTRQSGLQSFRIANIVRDLEILTAARKEAENALNAERLSPDTAEMVRLARTDKRSRLVRVG
jgi:ATP-dependent DNA helicase RecG